MQKLLAEDYFEHFGVNGKHATWSQLACGEAFFPCSAHLPLPFCYGCQGQSHPPHAVGSDAIPVRLASGTEPVQGLHGFRDDGAKRAGSDQEAGSWREA